MLAWDGYSRLEEKAEVDPEVVGKDASDT